MTEELVDKDHSEGPANKVDRRAAIAMGSASVASAGAAIDQALNSGSILKNIWNFISPPGEVNDKPKVSTPPVTPTPRAISTSTPQPMPLVEPKPRPAIVEGVASQESVPDEKLSDRDLMTQILQADLGSEVRREAERKLTSRIKTLDEIDLALGIVANPQTRMTLLAKRFQIRMERTNPALTLPTREQLDWCKQQKIHPETLGICLDAYGKAERIINALINKDRQIISQIKQNPALEDQLKKRMFRPDILYRQKNNQLPNNFFDSLTAVQTMINPGGLARLICTETGGLETVEKEKVGFSNIAEIPAVYQINPEVFPTGVSSVEMVANRLSELTGLEYPAEAIPGSPRLDPNENASGGAIFIQIMPDGVVELMDLVNNPEMDLSPEDRVLNPANVTDAAVMALIFISRATYLGKNSQGEEQYRTGYLRGEFVSNGVDMIAKYRRWALEKWNRHGPQIQSILDSANSYSNKFNS